jgi:hypothetical protein
MTDEPLIGMYELLDALEAVIQAADPAKRANLAEVVDGYGDTFPEEFLWATGAQAPSLLYHLMTTIDMSCRPEAQSKARPPIRLVTRQPQS